MNPTCFSTNVVIETLIRYCRGLIKLLGEEKNKKQ